jgi:TetR/AcrR family transcriptional regulator, lmrAB and yxaGH operons repressor
MLVVIVKGDSRERMLRAAVELFRERGYAATSFHDVIERSGAPRGSIYHHFPGGKRQLATEALAGYAAAVERQLTRAGTDPAAAVEAFLRASRVALLAHDFRAGCAVAGVAVDLGADDAELRAAVAAAFARWRTALTHTFTAAGATGAHARRLAHFVVAAQEGALLLTRAARDIQPLDDVATEVVAHVRAQALTPTPP